MSGVDDLFSPPGASGDAAPPVVDRLRRARLILGIALPLNLFGVFCFTGVPGAVLALVGWQLADEEVARVESGAIPKDQLRPAGRWRNFAFLQLVFAMFSLTIQFLLLSAGIYDLLLEAALGLLDPVPVV